MLDVPSITFLSNYLQTYPSTVLVVSHDRAFLNEIATDIIHQHSERLDYYKGANFDSFYATKEERRKTAKREYENQMVQRQHLQSEWNRLYAVPPVRLTRRFSFHRQIPIQRRQVIRSAVPNQEA